MNLGTLLPRHASYHARVGAKFQRVSDVWILDDFPRNVAGKTLKRALAADYAAGRERPAG